MPTTPKRSGGWPWQPPSSSRCAARAGGYTPAVGVDASPRELLDGLLLGWVQAGGQVVPDRGHSWRPRRPPASICSSFSGSCPADIWVLQRSVEAWLRFHWPVLFSPDFQLPYTSPPDSGMDSLGNFLLARGSTSDGQEAVMIPAAHQKLLEPAESDSPAASSGESDGVLPPWDESWIVQPDRSVIAPPNASPDALLDLWKVAQLESNQGASVFRITPESIAAALNRNVAPAEIRELSGEALPRAAAAHRRAADRRSGAAVRPDQGRHGPDLRPGRRSGPAGRASTRQAAPEAGLARRRPRRGVRGEQRSAAVLDSLRKAGYLPVLDQPRPTKAGQIQAVPSPASRSSGGSQRQKRGASQGDGMLRLARTALREERLLYVTWMDGADVREGELEIIDLHGRVIHADNLDDGENVMVPVDNIIEAELGDPLDDDIDLSFLDD